MYTTFLRSLHAAPKLESGWLVSNMQDSLSNLFLSMFIISIGNIVLVFTVIQKQMAGLSVNRLCFQRWLCPAAYGFYRFFDSELFSALSGV